MNTLVRIFDLIGKDVHGLRVDIRSRNADGSLRYEHQNHDGPLYVKLTRVVKRKDVHGNWMRWEWDTTGHYMPLACGFSGVVMDGERELEYYIETDGQK